MEPNFSSEALARDVLAELQRREPLFHRPEFGSTRAAFERMTEPAFREVGASGRRYSSEYVLSDLEKRYAREFEDVWETSDFDCLEIAPDNYLITYTLAQGARLTRCSTIWRRTGDGWKAVYQQRNRSRRRSVRHQIGVLTGARTAPS